MQAEQALTITDVSVSGDQDARFAWTGDDDTSFQVAVELSDGDGVLFDATLENSAAGELAVKVTVDARDVIDVDVMNNELLDYGRAERERCPDRQWNVCRKISDADSNSTAESVTEQSGVFTELDDTASPGSSDIGVAINPLSAN